ncbi:hypothetical protein PENSPDRAFT_650894 [Peniophora sp. CONT]|nr:hypothetical protein PENSPDRAFT_650894 [Peniophora sp. CONT]
MSARGPHFDGVRAAAALGIVTSGVLTGAIFATSGFAVPAILTTTRSSDGTQPLLRAFQRLVKQSKALSAPLGLVSGALFAYAAARATSTPFITNGSFGAAHRTLLFSLAAALSVGTLPFTSVAMAGNYEVLAKGADDKVEAERIGTDKAVQNVVQWASRNWVRGVLPLVGCALGTWASFAS